MTAIKSFFRAIKTAVNAPCPTWTEYLRDGKAAR